MSLVSDLIQGAFLDLDVIQIGESITTAMSDDALLRLNQILGSLSAEGVAVWTEAIQTFILTAGSSGYTLGQGGTWGTSARAQKVVGWRATSGAFNSGGRALSFGEFDAAADQAYQDFVKAAAQVQALMGPFFQTAAVALGNAQVPMILGADTAFPLINVRVFPAPLVNGSIEVAFWTPLPSFATVGDTLNLPPGVDKLLRQLLAADLYAQYPRPSNMQLIFGNAKDAKAALIEQNAMASPQPQPEAPAGQK